ncbi:MAG: formate dehydrogenase subunit alpha [Myxococcales bacterium FL481]|nr:MAG: formate dehydrogenase subunit alpha [Myxococcales bacterium FL481]
MAGLVKMFGAGAMTNSIPEIRDTDLMFVIGSNTTEAHPIIAMEMKRARQAGAKLIVADPRRIWLADYADVHLQLKPGTDVFLLNAMAKVIVDEGLVDQGFIDNHTKGWQALKQSLEKFPLDEAERVTRVPAELIKKAAIMYASTYKAGVYYTLGITEHSHGTDNVYSLANLVLMTGHLGRRSSGLNPLRGQNNVQGANDAGASPVFYPGYQSATDPEVRAKFSEAWNCDAPGAGMNLNQMMHAVEEGEMKALFVMGEDIVLSEPNTSKLEEGLKDLEFLVCQEILPNMTTEYADVILPGACFAEKDGVFTNSDRRVQRVRKGVNPPGNARADWQILVDLARAAGYDMPRYNTAADVYAEMASLAPKFAGISHERIDANPKGMQWPCVDADDPGTEFLHGDGPLSGKAGFQPVEYRASLELPDDDYPLILSTGRTLYHYNSATQTRREAGPDTKQGEMFVEVNPELAEEVGVADGEIVKIASRRGGIKAKVVLTDRVRKHSVWMPLHFAEESVNYLTNDVGDAVTGTPEYKVCAVTMIPLRNRQKAGGGLAKAVLQSKQE